MKQRLAWDSGKPYLQSHRSLSTLWHTLLAIVSRQTLFHLISPPFLCTKNQKPKTKKPIRSKVPELKQGRYYGESQGANFTCGFLLDERFARPAYHYFNSGTVSTQELCFV